MTGAKQQKPLDLEFDDALLTVVSDPNFLLHPKITLSVDACELGQCGICHESQLLLRDHGNIVDDRTVAILPCGHIAVRQSPFSVLPSHTPHPWTLNYYSGYFTDTTLQGYVCLSSWLDLKKSCPFCRIPLEYELCKHASNLIRPLTRETLYSIPDPIPTGGKILAQCFNCSVATNRNVNQQLLDGFIERFRNLRSEYHTADSEHVRLKTRHAIAAVKRKMDSTMQELAAPSSMLCIGW